MPGDDAAGDRLKRLGYDAHASDDQMQSVDTMQLLQLLDTIGRRKRNVVLNDHNDT